MVATFALVFALIGSALSQQPLSPVVLNGVRVAPNGPAVPSSQVRFNPTPDPFIQTLPAPRSFNFAAPQTFPSRPPSQVRTTPFFFSPSPPASSAFAPQTFPPPRPGFQQPLRSFPPSPSALDQSRFQSDFPALPQQTSFASPAVIGAQSPRSFIFQNEFTVPSPQLVTYPIVLNRVQQQDDSGAYSSQYQTSDGQSVKEVGTPKLTPDGSDVVITKEGHYAYTSPEGKQIAVSYIADDQGFRVNSPNLPQ